MVQITIDVDTSVLAEKLSPDKVREATTQGLDYASQEMVRVLVGNSPVDHGRLKGWFVESISDEEAVIKTPAEYARWVNDGHSQQPGRFIPGEWGGSRFNYNPSSKTGMVLVAPFVEGQHFVEDSIADVEGRLDGYFLKALSEVLG